MRKGRKALTLKSVGEAHVEVCVCKTEGREGNRKKESRAERKNTSKKRKKRSRKV